MSNHHKAHLKQNKTYTDSHSYFTYKKHNITLYLSFVPHGITRQEPASCTEPRPGQAVHIVSGIEGFSRGFPLQLQANPILLD